MDALWLEERRKGIGGSDVAPIMGLSPWKTAYQIYLAKKGDVKDWEGSDVMDWGKRMEPALRQWYSDMTGRTVRLPNKIMYHPEYSFMLASLDGYTDDRRVIEIKTSLYGKDWGEPGSAQIPDYYMVQVQHYLMVTGYPVADVIVSIGGRPPEMFEVPEDKELQEIILSECVKFWNMVQNNTPPPLTTYADAVARYGSSLTSGMVFAPEDLIPRVEELRSIKSEISELEKKEEDLKGQIIVVMGDQGDTLIDLSGAVLLTYKLTKGSRKLDVKKLQKEEPEIYNKYSKMSEPQRRFLLK